MYDHSYSFFIKNMSLQIVNSAGVKNGRFWREINEDRPRG